jgi:hypothetical protein
MASVPKEIIDVLIAEALGEGPDGIAAVAHVIQTRAAQSGESPADIVKKSGQFSGYENPGPSVRQSMNDPAVRAEVERIWDGVVSGNIHNPFPGADFFHTPEVSPYWADEFAKQGQIGNHIFYASAEGGSGDAANNPQPQAQPVSRTLTGGQEAYTQSMEVPLSSFSYDNAGAQRNLPVKKPLVDQLVQGVTAVYGPDYRVSVISGAQGEGSAGQTGTRRHGTGVSADVYVYAPNGRRLTPDELVPLSQHWLANDIGSVGFPANGQSLHLDLIGGSAPGSVPLASGEGRVWFYGQPTPTQRQALNGSLTNGAVPEYAYDPDVVAKGLIPPGSIPEVASQTDTVRVPPIPADPSQRPAEPYQVIPSFPSLDPSQPYTAAFAGTQAQMPDLPRPRPDRQPEYSASDMVRGTTPGYVPPMPTSATQSYASQDGAPPRGLLDMLDTVGAAPSFDEMQSALGLRTDNIGTMPARSDLQSLLVPQAPFNTDMTLLAPNDVTSFMGEDGRSYNPGFAGMRATLPNGQATLGADSFAAMEAMPPSNNVPMPRSRPSDLERLLGGPNAMAGADLGLLGNSPLASVLNLDGSVQNNSLLGPTPVSQSPSFAAARGPQAPMPASMSSGFAERNGYAPPTPAMQSVPFASMRSAWGATDPALAAALAARPPVPETKSPQMAAQTGSGAPFPATMSAGLFDQRNASSSEGDGNPPPLDTLINGVAFSPQGIAGNAQMPPDYRPQVTVPPLPQPGNTGPMDSVQSSPSWAEFTGAFFPETRIDMPDPMRSELDIAKPAFSASDMARGNTPAPAPQTQTTYETRQVANPAYTKALKDIELYNYVPPDIKQIMNFTPAEMERHKQSVARAEQAKAAPLPDQYIAQQVPVTTTVAAPVPTYAATDAMTRPPAPRVSPMVPPPPARPQPQQNWLEMLLGFDASGLINGVQDMFSQGRLPIDQKTVGEMGQMGLLNQLSYNALRDDKRSYLGSGGSVMPTVSLNGSIRNSYADGQFGGPTSGSLG